MKRERKKEEKIKCKMDNNNIEQRKKRKIMSYPVPPTEGQGQTPNLLTVPSVETIDKI